MLAQSMTDKVENSYREILQRISILSDSGDKYITSNGDIIPVTEDGVPIRKLFVSNLAARTTHKDLISLFSKYGQVESCFLKRNSGNANYAFVIFSHVEGAIMARKDGNRKNIMVHGRCLRVLPADPWHQPDIPKCRYYNSEDYIQDDITENHIHRLNDDCLLHIFSFLPILTRYRIQRVCKRWKNISTKSWGSITCLDICPNKWETTKEFFLLKMNTMTFHKVLLSCGKYLTTIKISSVCHSLNSNVLTIIGKLCPKLQIIHIPLLDVSGSGIRSLAENCRDITELNLRTMDSTCDCALTNLFRANQKLRYIKISGVCVLHKSLMNLPACSMKEIRLERCKFISNNSLFQVLEKLKKLESLSLVNCTGLHGDVLQEINTYCINLKELCLNDNRHTIKLDNISYPIQFVNLQVLDLDVTIITKEILINIALKCQNLIDLRIFSKNTIYCNPMKCSATNERLPGTSVIPSLSKLQKLTTDSSYYIINFHVFGMYNLRFLAFEKCYTLYDSCLSDLIECSPRLQELRIYDSPHISNRTINQAKVAVKRRPNNIVLSIIHTGTGIVTNQLRILFPLLKIIHLGNLQYEVKIDKYGD